jgi:hypothetical protein
VCSGENKIFWSGTSQDIDTLSRLSVIALAMDLTNRTCELLSSLQGWPTAGPNRRHWRSQRHIEYFEKNPLDTVALFSMAWHDNLSPNVRRMCERFTAFAEAQGTNTRLAIMRGTEMLVDHRVFYMRPFPQASTDLHVARQRHYKKLVESNGGLIREIDILENNDGLIREIDILENNERPLKDVERILQAVELLCQSAVYREYMEELSKSKGDKAGEMWKDYWNLQVDTAIAKEEGTIWELLKTFGHPSKESAVHVVKGIGRNLWGRLSQPIHHPNLQAVEDRLNTPLDHWNADERRVLLVIKEMAHELEEAEDEMPEWKKKVDWRS